MPFFYFKNRLYLIKEMIWEFTTTIKVHAEPKLWRSKLKEKDQDQSIPLDQVITLDHLTNPDKK